MASITRDKLTWIYTTYGLRRITEVMNNPDSKLAITKLVVGDSEVVTYDEETGLPIYHHDYYTPDPNQVNLKHPVDSFFFHGKSHDKDNDIVTFTTNIPENKGGYTINELGIFEDGNLLALCTCQGLAKPLLDDNYIMDITYSISLHSHNLSTIYDQIVLNVDSEYLQPQDLEKVQYSILYMEGNLIEQISENSHIIGLNRPRQLEQLVNENTRKSGTALLTSTYTNFCGLTSFENVKNFWVFDYGRYLGEKTCILDMGYNGEHLDLTKELRDVEVKMKGLCPTITLDNELNISSENSIADTGAKTWFFLLQHENTAENATIFAKSNENGHEFEFMRHIDGSYEFKMYMVNGDYISFTSEANAVPESMYVLTVNVPSSYRNNSVTCMINGKTVGLTRTVYGRLDNPANLTAGYTTYIPSGDNITYPSNSTLGLIVKVADTMETAEIKGMSLALSALCGNNVYLTFR